MNCRASEPGQPDASVPETVVNPDPVRIDRIKISASAKIKEMGAAHGLPYLKRFLKHIERRQEHADERFGRRYQREILRRRGLRLLSPQTGEPVTATESVSINGKTFYRFLEPNRTGAPLEYFVVASRVRWGFPLAAIFVPRQNWLLAWESGGKHAVALHHLAELTEARGALDTAAPVSQEPVILIGDTSFAHHLWNELSALETIVRSNCLSPRSQILVAREPLGNIEEIFPELLGQCICRVDSSMRSCGTLTGGLFVDLGGLCIPDQLRRRVVAFAQSRASAAARRIIEDIVRTGGPVFWISVRTQNPTLTNQHDVLVRIVGMLLHTYKNCAVVFDGFSLPQDFTRMPPSLQSAHARTASETLKASEEIIATVRATTHCGPHQLVTTIAGMTLLDCFAIAQSATVYLCHAGSIQHKIGWTANVPGIIHGNRPLPASELVARHSSRLENGVPPMLMPSELLCDVAGDEREPNYTCVEPAEFSRLVLAHFRRCLALAPCVPG